VKVGAHYLGNGQCEFTVWAPALEKISVQLLEPKMQSLALERQTEEYWHGIAQEVYPGTRYRYQLNDHNAYPDPASQFQPCGVHSPSQVVNPSFDWTDSQWVGVPLDSMILYELHVGTFTLEGTFEAIIPRLPDLQAVGITAIEIMPIAQFSGDPHTEPDLAYRNWGYDGVYLYAAQNSYGGPDGFKRLVDACHQHGIAVVLDVVYNHFGPEGNYMKPFAPYFTEAYWTPWGSAMNFDGAYSQGVRNFFIENALYWLRDCHVDAFRLDAIQTLYDLGAKHFLQELAEAVDQFSQEDGRKRYLIAESDLNDPRIIRPTEVGGYGLDAQWNDDFHYALHTLLIDDRHGHYQDFGKVTQLAKAYEDNFIYDWQYSPYRKRFHGMPCRDRPLTQFIIYTQNHDQIANPRLSGARMSELTDLEGAKLAAGAMLLSASTPMLFMGEEYGETAPFNYFVSHSDPHLIHAVQEGRKREFTGLGLTGESPNPSAIATFLACKLNWELRNHGKHKILLEFYQQLIQLRKTHPALLNRDRQFIQATADEANKLLLLYRWCGNKQLVSLMNFNHLAVTFPVTLSNGEWQKQLDSAEERWLGSGSQLPETLSAGQEISIQPKSLAIYECVVT
jgi:maltooligosyltrehalose trehalohydrolase